jgi:uncharacterized protein (DUF2147 family)
MKRLCSFAALVLLSTSAHAGTIFSFEIEGRAVHINAPNGCTSLACISVSSPGFHGSNYRHGSRNKLASKPVSARKDKAGAPAGTLNSLSLIKTPNAEDAIAPPRAPISTADSRPVVVSTEPTKARSIDMPTPPATVVGTRPSPTDSNAASGPTSLTKQMPLDAASDGSASPANAVATPSRSPSPSTVDSATPMTSGVYKPVQTALSSAPAVEYDSKAKENQTSAPAEDTIASPRTPISTANSRPVVVSTEPTKAPSIDMVAGTRPSPTDSPMPVDATSDGSAPLANAVATSSRSPSPSTVESATLITGSVYKPVQTASSLAPAVMYYGKAKENQASAPAVEYYRKAKENPNRETSDAGRSASLLGDWQIKGQKRAIHIEQCDLFVCGYVADSSNKEKVLIDLKPTSSSEWIGLIASAESNIMYPAVVILEDAKTLRVRACALGITFCEGQIWTREEPVLAAVH